MMGAVIFLEPCLTFSYCHDEYSPVFTYIPLGAHLYVCYWFQTEDADKAVGSVTAPSLPCLGVSGRMTKLLTQHKFPPESNEVV